MHAEREFEAGAAITIALAIIPMNWIAYTALSLVLAALVARIIWLSLPKRWERWTAIAGAVVMLAVLTVPEIAARFITGMP